MVARFRGLAYILIVGLLAFGTQNWAVCNVQAPQLMLVTGASKGVGAAIANHYAGKGSPSCGCWRVAALARDEVKLKELASAAASDAQGTSPGILPLVCDVGDAKAVEQAVQEACSHFDCASPAVLVNNAALYVNRPFDEISVTAIDDLVGVNLKGAMYATRSVLPRMKKAGAGRIIFINSVAGLPTWTIEGEALYCATKHGLSGFADALANEQRRNGILVTSIHPGGIDTPLQVAAGASEEVRAQFLSTQDVVKCIDHVVQADPHILYKRVEVFGSSFWH